jgi:hypothetical protein
MSKTKKIIYWVATIWLALGMVSTGIVQFMKVPAEADSMARLGYPLYLLTLLAIWKILGTVAVLAPGLALVKEWAYAGFFFAMSGAVISHSIMGHPFTQLLPSLLLLVLTIISWYCRPAGRRLAATRL